MKVIKFVTTFLLLMSLGIFISYADIKYNNWTSNFVETFEETNAKFKFYDIKINYTVNGNLSENEVQNMFINLAESLNVDEKKIKWNIKDKDEVKIYAQLKDDVYNISFAATKRIRKNTI